MSLAYVIVDVFTDTPLQCNQLSVFEDGSALSDDQMQRLAREMNLSETGFLLPAEDGDVADAARRMADTLQRDTPVGPRLVHRQGPEPPAAAVGLPPASPFDYERAVSPPGEHAIFATDMAEIKMASQPASGAGTPWTNERSLPTCPLYAPSQP